MAINLAAVKPALTEVIRVSCLLVTCRRGLDWRIDLLDTDKS
jgi:hypothetical protein